MLMILDFESFSIRPHGWGTLDSPRCYFSHGCQGKSAKWGGHRNTMGIVSNICSSNSQQNKLQQTSGISNLKEAKSHGGPCRQATKKDSTRNGQPAHTGWRQHRIGRNGSDSQTFIWTVLVRSNPNTGVPAPLQALAC